MEIDPGEDMDTNYKGVQAVHHAPSPTPGFAERGKLNIQSTGPSQISMDGVHMYTAEPPFVHHKSKVDRILDSWKTQVATLSGLAVVGGILKYIRKPPYKHPERDTEEQPTQFLKDTNPDDVTSSASMSLGESSSGKESIASSGK